MAGLTTTGSDLSALIQIQGDTANSGALRSLRALQNAGANSRLNSETIDRPGESVDSQKALKTAREFESLLIHSMLKSMRKTTMAENTSNQKAMYDDMLDKQLADTMVEGGGLGVANQLFSQLDAKNNQTVSTQDRLRLRALMSDENMRPQEATTKSVSSLETVANLRMGSMLGDYLSHDSEPKSLQQQFTEPLQPHARRSADKLGTTPNAVLAIAALETGWGRHVLQNDKGESTHNYFGIKATGSDSEFSENATREFLDGGWQRVQAKFKTYDNVEDSIDGFTNFILENPRYSKAIEHAQDPERFLKEIHKAGYATDPQYADKAISILHQINQMTARL